MYFPKINYPIIYQAFLQMSEFLLKIAPNWLEVAHALLVDNQRLPLQ